MKRFATSQVPATRSMMAVISSVFAVGAVGVLALSIAAIVGICIGIAAFLNIAFAELSSLCTLFATQYNASNTTAHGVLWIAAMCLTCLLLVVMRYRGRSQLRFAWVEEMDYE